MQWNNYISFLLVLIGTVYFHSLALASVNSAIPQVSVFSLVAIALTRYVSQDASSGDAGRDQESMVSQIISEVQGLFKQVIILNLENNSANRLN